jgi:hypothetical protein
VRSLAVLEIGTAAIAIPHKEMDIAAALCTPVEVHGESNNE